jgi:pullulanase
MKNEIYATRLNMLLGISLLLGLAFGDSKAMMFSAKISSLTTIDVRIQDGPANPGAGDFAIQPGVSIKNVVLNQGVVRLFTTPLDLTQSYTITCKGVKKELQPDGALDSFYSLKELGCTWNEDRTIFRVFAPRAKNVELVLFDSLQADRGQTFEMYRDSDGVWECLLAGQYMGYYYNYRVDGPTGSSEAFDRTRLVCDPYSRAVATQNDHWHRGRTLILDSSRFDWEGDTWLGYKLQDMMIYECHMRDMSAHPSSGVEATRAGSYKGFLAATGRGGIQHIKSLGVNAVEFLPIHDFGNMEIPYNVPVDGVTNTWNPYSRNHWGYMSSYFFAPESYYSEGQNLESSGWCGGSGNQVNEFKEVVKALHKAGIAVILDVVYNHVSQYDQNAFKLIDKKYYFRLDDEGQYLSTSGCGNDFKTERPMAQRLIVESVLFWMKEYHIDGFRFDLAAMIDWQTVDLITKEARKVNPNVILIAEPWGGGHYSPAEFSQHDWAAWNDQFRNGVKGQNPENGQSYIFGRYWGDNSKQTLKRYIAGTLAAEGGLFQKSVHAVNYLGSHDDHTFGDFVRIGLDDVLPNQTVQNLAQHARLTPRQLKVNKLGALILYASQGSVMIEEGQEYGRSKVIAKSSVPDPNVGRIDHNSYNKDNETNWLNYEHADMNKELVQYYAGLAALRKSCSILRNVPREALVFIEHENAFALGFTIDRRTAAEHMQVMVLINAHPSEKAVFSLPSGRWGVLADEQNAGDKVMREVSGPSTAVPPISGMVLVRRE